MRRWLSTALAMNLGLVPALPACAQSMTVDKVIEKHIEAIGGYDALKSIQNIVYRQKPDADDGAMMTVGRPYHKLVGDKNNPRGYLEGYDGSAWEWFEEPGVVIRTTGKPSAAIRHYAGVDRQLVDYRERGTTAELLEDIKIDGRPAYTIKVTLRDGFVNHIYIDKESYLEIANSYSAPLHAFGDDIQFFEKISDYREVGGVKIAHRYEDVKWPSGESRGLMQWGKIEVNVDLPKDWFSPPAFTRSKLQTFIEDLYGQREDIHSVVWTYEEFRRAYPDLDTSDGVNVAAYQCLKMGSVDTAIKLLQRNVANYPKSADARFGLGRAYRTSGDTQRARESFKAALTIDPKHKRAKAALADF